jgi:hypothetical protein
MQRVPDPLSLILHAPQEHDDRRADREHHWMVEHLDSETPFVCRDLFRYRLLWEVVDMIASTT